jgi:heme o synthase
VSPVTDISVDHRHDIAALAAPGLVSEATAADYLALLKPRVMSLVVFTAFVGLMIAPGHVHPVIGLAALLCIAVGAGAAGALNMWYDADIDAVMVRTAARPIPRGRIAPGEAAGFGLTLAGFAVTLLGLLVNWFSAALLAITIAFYVVIYTMWLKRSTPQNIVIGGAAGALNMWYDADIDAVMVRTAARPIPRGRIAPGEAAGFGLTLAGFAVTLLGLLVNWFSAALLAFTIAFYVVIYTMWLKRSTPQNIVIGGAAGAFPPIIGWAAVTGNISLEPVLLFLIIFFWTPPHFWALSLTRTDDYARAHVPMLPVVAGADETLRQILLYSIALVPVGAAPWLFGFAGLAYGVIALIGGALMVALALNMRRKHAGHDAKRASLQMFAFSIVYLFVLFAVLLIERGFAALLDRVAA